MASMPDTPRNGEARGGDVLLDVRNLSTDFVMKRGTVHAVIDVSFTVREGEVLAIVGESGSGKSVTAMSILNLLPDNAERAGAITFMGRDMLAASLEVFPLDRLPQTLCFDHATILADYFRFRASGERPPLDR